MSEDDYGGKVRKVARKYDVEGFLADLAELYESNDVSLREVERVFNTRVVVERLAGEGVVSQTGGRKDLGQRVRSSDGLWGAYISSETAEVTVPELTLEEVVEAFVSPDELAARDQRRIETLVEQNVNGEYADIQQEIRQDTVSYQTIRHYLNNYEAVDTSVEGTLTPEEAVRRHFWAVANCEGVLETLVSQLERHEIGDVDDVSVSVDVRYETSDGASLTIHELVGSEPETSTSDEES